DSASASSAVRFSRSGAKRGSESHRDTVRSTSAGRRRALRLGVTGGSYRTDLRAGEIIRAAPTFCGTLKGYRLPRASNVRRVYGEPGSSYQVSPVPLTATSSFPPPRPQVAHRLRAGRRDHD